MNQWFQSPSPSYGVSGGPAISPLSSVKFSSTKSTFIWFLLVWKGEKANNHSSLDQTGSVQSVLSNSKLPVQQKSTPPPVVLAKVDLNLLHTFCDLYI